MYLISAAAKTKGGIKEYNWEEVDSQVYDARYKIFSAVPVPRYTDYLSFTKSMKDECYNLGIDGLLIHAKQYFSSA